MKKIYVIFLYICFENKKKRGIKLGKVKISKYRRLELVQGVERMRMEWTEESGAQRNKVEEVSSATSKDGMKMLWLLLMMMIMIMAYMDRWNNEEDKIIVNFNATAT